MGRCPICNGRVWFWQRKVQSKDKAQVAHLKCKPQGFHRSVKCPKCGEYALLE